MDFRARKLNIYVIDKWGMKGGLPHSKIQCINIIWVIDWFYSRINEYSPTDVSKANERSVNRRNNVRFNPKATVDILSQGEPSEDLDDDQKRELVQKYIEVRYRL